MRSRACNWVNVVYGACVVGFSQCSCSRSVVRFTVATVYSVPPATTGSTVRPDAAQVSRQLTEIRAAGTRGERRIRA